jgi:hypothetical protein
MRICCLVLQVILKERDSSGSSPASDTPLSASSGIPQLSMFSAPSTCEFLHEDNTSEFRLLKFFVESNRFRTHGKKTDRPL